METDELPWRRSALSECPLVIIIIISSRHGREIMAINGHIIYDKPLTEVEVVIDQLTVDAEISWVSICKTEWWKAKRKRHNGY